MTPPVLPSPQTFNNFRKLNRIVLSGDLTTITIRRTDESITIMLQRDGFWKTAILQADNHGKQGWWVNRVNVPKELTNKGYGTVLLSVFCYLMDALNHKSYLCVSSSGRLSNWALRDWYSRYGFLCKNYEQHRNPRLPIQNGWRHIQTVERFTLK